MKRGGRYATLGDDWQRTRRRYRIYIFIFDPFVLPSLLGRPWSDDLVQPGTKVVPVITETVAAVGIDDDRKRPAKLGDNLSDDLGATWGGDDPVLPAK